ncbi:MAG: riboflavin synthase [Parasphingorhabdus sp.]|jgi:riboflavin synthase
MFTGLIQALGKVIFLEPRHGDLSLVVLSPEISSKHPTLGDSIAINGVCLTVTDLTDGIRFDVSTETLSRTLMSEWQVGDSINLETALQIGDALGGHLVSGHVDGVGVLLAQESDARSTRMTFSVPDNLAKFIAEKGSVCIDGISLTVNGVRDGMPATTFDVNIVPHTLLHTNLGQLQAGSKVHLEIDQVARYLDRLMTFSKL